MSKVRIAKKSYDFSEAARTIQKMDKEFRAGRKAKKDDWTDDPEDAPEIHYRFSNIDDFDDAEDEAIMLADKYRFRVVRGSSNVTGNIVQIVPSTKMIVFASYI